MNSKIIITKLREVEKRIQKWSIKLVQARHAAPSVKARLHRGHLKALERLAELMNEAGLPL